jgi:thiol-disulfide isomerase/thioredoxin
VTLLLTTLSRLLRWCDTLANHRDVRVSTPDHFESFIDAVTETGVPVLALFTAPAWCIPCQRFEPHWQKAQDMLPNHMFINVNMGEKPEDTYTHWATAEWGIRGVPTVKLFDDDGVREIKPVGVIPFIKEVEGG